MVEPTKRAHVFDDGMAGRHPLRVLVAEDNSVSQMIVQVMLEKLGYAAEVVSSGEEAVDAVTERPFDVVLMDVQMPGMDGLEASREIIARRRHLPRPRIVALTATATADDRRRCMSAGMDDYATKPLTPAKLVEILEGCVIVDYVGR